MTFKKYLDLIYDLQIAAFGNSARIDEANKYIGKKSFVISEDGFCPTSSLASVSPMHDGLHYSRKCHLSSLPFLDVLQEFVLGYTAVAIVI